MNVENNRTLGGIGACLTLVGAIGTAATVIQSAMGTVTTLSAANIGLLGVGTITSICAFVGFILFLIAMHGLSQDFGERKIFTYLLYGLIFTIVAAIVAGVVWFVLLLANLLSYVTAQTTLPPTSSTDIQSILTPYLAPLTAIMSVVVLIWIFYNYKAFNLLAQKTEVPGFRTAAQLFVLGAIITLVLTVALGLTGKVTLESTSLMPLAAVPGGAIQYIGWVFAARGFFSIKTSPSTVAAIQEQTYTPTVNPAIRYCMHCGTQNQADSTYCIRCGEKMA